jgi:phosphatidylglycerophosphatase A
MIERIKMGFAYAVATSGGLGFSPWMPGTFGTLGGVLLHLWTVEWSWPARILFWILVLALGTWSASVVVHNENVADSQKIVVDEVLGFGITAFFSGGSFPALLACFIAFRFFDILKIPPVRQVDRWSKTTKFKGFGVMADDILAGFQALGVVLILQYVVGIYSR